jgi:membrane protein implicated in regulation of membrane protease activity
MTWSDFYLICFAVGFFFSLLSFALAGLQWHLPFDVHLPHGWDLWSGPAHLPGGHGGAGGASGHASGSGHTAAMSPFNPVTTAAFLAWFGGAGYLVTRFSSIWVALGLMIALGAGLVGAAIVFLFLSRVLISREENMDPADYEMTGVLGRISIPIRAGGTGEIIYSQAGTRRTCGARSEDGSPVEKGCEVVVTRYEKGIAYVRRWAEMSGE